MYEIQSAQVTEELFISIRRVRHIQYDLTNGVLTKLESELSTKTGPCFENSLA